MRVKRLDHIVLCVADVQATCRFYERVLGMEAREELPGKWSLHFAKNKISLQEFRNAPELARATVPGSGNFCLLVDLGMEAVVKHLRESGVQAIDGPGERMGAAGPIMSVYFRDPDGNLVEVSNQISPSSI